MELRHLRYFQAVAELLNFSRAAERLHVAQPALSRQIRDLEQELGTQLFERNRVRVSLTDAGRTFYSHVCKILAQVDIAIGSVQETTSGTSGELIICNDWRLSNPVVLGTIAEYREKHPRVDVTLRDLHLHHQLNAIRSRQAHLGFVVNREFAPDDELASLSVITSDLMIAVGANHRLASQARVRLADLADERWLTMEPKETPGLREFITQICRLSGFTPEFAPPEHNSEALIGRVATGYGVCLWPKFLNTSTPVHPFVRYLHSDCPPIEIRAVWHRGETSRLLEQFLTILRQRSLDTAAAH